MTAKSVGILGGMGPEATVDLMSRIIKATPAKDDRDHIRMLVDNNPQVPSRIEALEEGGGASPVPCLQAMARRLALWGVDLLAMPCNTAHYYHPQIQQAVAIPVLNMLDLSATAVRQRCPEARTVGLLASTASVRLKLYAPALGRQDLQLLTPATEVQEALMSAIRQIKAGVNPNGVVSTLQQTADSLIQAGADVLLVACTELSIVSDRLRVARPWLDSAQILAEAVVRHARPDEVTGHAGWLHDPNGTTTGQTS
ncbi:MAG TPA: amino acid racemase [Thioalkalivibrio sp.]|nr:amino acid racemase [Thioalkalivibrio sp.]